MEPRFLISSRRLELLREHSRSDMELASEACQALLGVLWVFLGGILGFNASTR